MVMVIILVLEAVVVIMLEAEVLKFIILGLMLLVVAEGEMVFVIALIVWEKII